MSAILRSLPIALLGVLLIALLVGTVSFVLRQLDLLPPSELSIAAGAPGSSYYRTAEAYREVLARDDIALTIRETRGSVENAALLTDEDPVDIALVQGGVPLAADIEGLASLALEPLWVFGADTLPQDPNRWTDLRVSAGSSGSGTRLVADRLATITGASALAPGAGLNIGADAAVDALMANSADVALFVAPARAEYLQELLVADGIRLHALMHSEALALRLPGARLVRLPSGILDYGRHLPERDVDLVALVTRLVAREGLHPALVNRLIHAVLEVHAGRGILPADSAYPASTDLGIEPVDYAVQLLDKGFSPLEKFLPYWIVAQFNRVLLVLVPATLLLLPLLRLLPALYEAMLKRRVFRHYARVHEIDEALLLRPATLDAERLSELHRELDTIERQLLRTNLPNSYRKQAYTLLHHLDYVRKRLAERVQDTQGAS